MSKYIKLFNTDSEYNLYVNEDLLLPNISYCKDINSLYYMKLIYGILKINGYQVPHIESRINTTFFNNPFTIKMTTPIDADSAIIKIYNPGYDEINDEILWEPDELIETLTATSVDGINWVGNIQTNDLKWEDHVITITFTINNEQVTYETFYKLNIK